MDFIVEHWGLWLAIGLSIMAFATRGLPEDVLKIDPTDPYAFSRAMGPRRLAIGSVGMIFLVLFAISVLNHIVDYIRR